MTDESLFARAVAIPDAAERAAFLDRECAGNPTLRREVEELLAAHAKAGTFLVDPAPPSLGEPSADPEPPAPGIGTVVGGRYRLLQRIGEGGMGTVWMADQTDPVKRRVAVKLIRAEKGSSKTILSRFEAERQAIALMDHPHIAKLLDAGTAESGQPFFVMELVKGVPLTEFCDAHRLGIPDRLALFGQVCGAVQHAHQKGIIHRDLKPSNVLVESHDGRPVPKVIDFGLAKATTGLPLTDHTLFTGLGTVLGTPLYMAPEQARFDAVDVDTRADVYALGVVLYELLTGTTPLTREAVRKAALDEVLRLVREQEAPTPSSRLGSSGALPTVAANRQTEPAKLGRFVRGELDWIVLKALAKDRDRRYESASGFARDVERFLNHEPVSAGPPSAGYRLRKFVRRNRGPVVATGLVLLALVGGVVGTTLGLVEAKRQEGIARGEAAQREAARADEARQRGVAEAKQKEAVEEKAKAVAAAAAEKVARQEEERERKFAQAVAGLFKDDFLALTSVEGQTRFGGARLDRNATLLDLLNRAAGKLKVRTDLDPRTEAELCWIVGVSYRGAGDAANGLPFLERAVELRSRVFGPDHDDTLDAQNSLGAAYRAAGFADKAVPLFEDCLRVRQARHGPDHKTTLRSLLNLAAANSAARHFDKAVPLAEECLRLSRARLGPDHPDTLASLDNLAATYLAAGHPGKAVPLAEECLRLSRARLGPDHPDTLLSMHGLASSYAAAGQPGKAVPLAEDCLRLRRARLGPYHPDTASSLNNLALCYRAVGHPGKAVPIAEEAFKLFKAGLGPDHPDTLASMANLAVSYWSVGRLDQSVPLLEQLLPLEEKKFGRDHPYTLATAANLGVNYKDAGRLAEGLPLLEEAYRASKKHPTLDWVGRQLLSGYAKAGKAAEAAKLIDDLLADARKQLPRDEVQLAGTLAQYGLTLLNLRAFAQAEPLLRECLAVREKAQPDGWTTSNTRSVLGGALLGQGNHADAEPLLLAGYTGLKEREKTIPPLGRERLPEAADRLVELYEATGKPAEAAKWRAERGKYPFVAPPPREKR
jgi:hypothetical protein